MDRQQLEAAIVAQEALRGQIPEEIVDTTVTVLRERLSTLDNERRRRQVTVLFADVSGFTAMSESMDAERVGSIMNALWERLDAVVVGHAGRIDKHIGDALMALWGAGSTREDDPEQAIRAALDLQRSLHDFREETGLPLTMRVGINTGPVLLGTVGSLGEFTAMGDTVNLASRLEHAAPVGGVLISHGTYRHVRGVFDVRPMEPLMVKGKSEPVVTYRVLSAKQRAFREPSRGIEGIETRMVGRDREFGVVQASFRGVVSGGGACLVTIEAEAGVGKSRLLYEIGSWLELLDDELFYFRARCTSLHRHVPWSLLRDLLASRCGIVESDNADAVIAKLVSGTTPTLTPQEATVVGSWLGFDLTSAQHLGEIVAGNNLAVAGRAHFSRYLRAMADESPVVFLLEDLHWVDSESLGSLTGLVSELADVRVLVVATARPDLGRDRPGWAEGVERHEEVFLDVLSSDDTRALLEEILQRADRVPPELVEVLIARAEGNAFYVEELVKVLIDSGVIIRDGPDGTWSIDSGRFDLSAVPATLVGVIQARLDALDPDSRLSVQRAAVVGRIFWSAAVASAIDGPAHLGVAVERELVYPRLPSAFAGTSEMIFKNTLIHDVVYETVLLSERPVLHGRVAEWLESVVAQRRDEYLVDLAEHYRLADEPAEAARLFAEAAVCALRTGAPRETRRLAEQSLDLWARAGKGPDPRVLIVLGRAQRTLGDLDASHDVLRAAVGITRTAGDDAGLVEALYETSFTTSSLGDFAAARGLLDEAMPVAERVGGISLAHVLTGLAWAYLDDGDLAATTAAATRAVAVARTTGDIDVLKDALSILGGAAIESSDWELGFRWLEEGLDLCSRLGDLVGVGVLMGNLGVAHHLLGEELSSIEQYQRAADAYRAGLTLALQVGNQMAEAVALSNLSEVTLRLGDTASALELSRESIIVAVRSTSIPTVLSAVLHYSEILIEHGDVAGGRNHILAVHQHPALGSGHADLDRLIRRLRDHGIELDLGVAEPQIGFDELLAAIMEDTQDIGRAARPSSQ